MSKASRQVIGCFVCLLLVSSLFLAASPIAAASYVTSLFPWRDHNFQGLSFFLAGTDSPDALTLEYQTKASPEIEDQWQNLTDLTCQKQGDLLACQAHLPGDLAPYLQFRLTYPDEITLKSLNYQLTAILPDAQSPTPDDDAIFYSNFKTLDPNLIAKKLTWKEGLLTEAATDQLLVQTRASYDNQIWTSWSGNFLIATPSSALSGQTAPESSQSAVFEASGGSILVKNLPSADFDRIYVSYLDQAAPLTLTAPAATGDDETAANQNLSFHLQSITGLRLGEKLQFTQIVGDTTYQATGIIADLKPSENLVSVYSWQGAIPYQLPSHCDDHHFCFSSSAQVFKITDAFLASPAQLDLPLSLSLPNVTQPRLLDLQFIQTITPACHQINDEDPENPQCVTYGLDLTPYYQSHQKPQVLQYRLIYGQNRDKLVTDVFLHQEPPTAGTPTGSSLNRLRGGKIFDPSKSSRPFYWN